MKDLGGAAAREGKKAVGLKASGATSRRPREASIWDASISAVPHEMAGIKGLSSCGRKEMQSRRRERRLHYAQTRSPELQSRNTRADGGRRCCSAESAEMQPCKARR